MLEDVNSNFYLLEKDKSNLFLDKISKTEKSSQIDQFHEKVKNKKMFYSLDKNQQKNKNYYDEDLFLSDEEEFFENKGKLDNVFSVEKNKLFDDNLFDSIHNENQELSNLKKRNYTEYKDFHKSCIMKRSPSYNIENKLNYFHHHSKYNQEIQNEEKKTLTDENTNSTISDLSKKKSCEKIIKSENNFIILTDKQKSKIKKISLFWKNKTKLIPNVFRNLKNSYPHDLFLFEKQDLSHKEVLGKLFI